MQLNNVCIDKHKRKQLPLTPPAVFRHFNLKVDTRTSLFLPLFNCKKNHPHEQNITTQVY